MSFSPGDRYRALTEFALDIQRPNPDYDGKRHRQRASPVSVRLLKGLVILLVLTNLVTLLVK